LPVKTQLAGQYTERTVEQRNIDNEISAAQIAALYQHMRMVLAVNVVNSALVALVLGRIVLPLGPDEAQRLTVVDKGADGQTSVRQLVPVRFSRLETVV